MYSGFRIVAAEGASSQPFRAHGTVIAGCSCAMPHAQLLLVRVLKSIAAAHPQVRLGSMVDDFSAQCIGTRAFVLAQLGGAATKLAAEFRRRRLPIHPGKTGFMASSGDLAQELAAQRARPLAVGAGQCGRRQCLRVQRRQLVLQ